MTDPTTSAHGADADPVVSDERDGTAAPATPTAPTGQRSVETATTDAVLHVDPEDYERPVIDAPTRRPFRFTLKLLMFLTVIYYFVVPIIPDFRNAWEDLRRVEPVLLVAGLLLEIMALYCYAPLMKAALGDAGNELSIWRLFRIQMSTRALSSIVPGGSAASSALGYRLMTLSGVSGPDAGFALATVGLGSAVMLNLILWCGLIVSILIRGVNPIYASAALAGVLVMGLAATLVFGLMEGQGRSERVIRWIARKLRLDEDKAAIVLHRVAERLEQLISDRHLLGRVAFWAALNWLFDMAALWVFLRAFNTSMPIDGLIVSFGIANVLAAIPITPGGLGYVDASYVALLVGFGASRSRATLGVAAYRFAQFFFPILLGGVLYLSLRVGPWSIERRDRLMRLRDLAEEETRRGESKIDFQLRFPTRDDTGELIRRPPSTRLDIEHHQERFRRWRRDRS
jgi:putative heme transporter